jgi:hypothetical protein
MRSIYLRQRTYNLISVIAFNGFKSSSFLPYCLHQMMAIDSVRERTLCRTPNLLASYWPHSQRTITHPVKHSVRCFPAIRVAKSAYGLGVYASRPISKGEILLIEKPLLTALTDGEAEMVFYDLPLPSQMAVMGLNDPECNADHHSSHLDHSPDLLAACLPTFQIRTSF